MLQDTHHDQTFHVQGHVVSKPTVIVGSPYSKENTADNDKPGSAISHSPFWSETRMKMTENGGDVEYLRERRPGDHESVGE